MPTQQTNTPVKNPVKYNYENNHTLNAYDDLVTRLATLMVQQCNLYSSKVPDALTTMNKPYRLLEDVMIKLEQCQEEQ